MLYQLIAAALNDPAWLVGNLLDILKLCKLTAHNFAQTAHGFHGTPLAIERACRAGEW